MTEAEGGAQTRIAVLASGGGSNLEAVLLHFDALGARSGGRVVLVASDRGGAPALERARTRSIPAVHIVAPSDGPAIEALLEAHDVGLVVLAGYLRLIPATVIRRYHGRVINIHPTLLPAFGGPGMYGLRAHSAVLDAGVRVSGASAHFVDEEYDRGAIIAQWPVPVLGTDTPESLAARVLRVEHLLYPRVVDAVARGAIALGNDRRVRYAASTVMDASMFSLTSNAAGSVAHCIDQALG